MKSLKRRAGMPLFWLVGGSCEFGLDLGDQPGVAGEAEQIIDCVVFAPRDQRLARKAPIAPQQDTHGGPARADRGDKARHLLDCAGAAVDAGRARPGRQQVLAAEDVERQVAVAIVTLSGVPISICGRAVWLIYIV